MSEISIRPDEVLGELTKVVSEIKSMPEPSSASTFIGPASQSVRGFHTALERLAEQLETMVANTRLTIHAASGSIRAAVEDLVARDAELADEVAPLMALLDTIDPAAPAVSAQPGSVPATAGGPTRMRAAK